MVSYVYDNAGNQTKVTDTNNGTTAYTYDACNQVKTKTLPNGVESVYTYAVNGWLTKREEVGKTTKETYLYEYDKNGNLTKETKETTGVAGITEITRNTYDAINQLISVTDSDGTRESLPNGLKIIQRGARLEHFEIVPESEIPFELFQSLLRLIRFSGPY